MCRLLVKWHRAQSMLYQQSGRMPTFEEVISTLNLTRRQESALAQAHASRQVRLMGCARDQSTCRLGDDPRDWEAPRENVAEAKEEWSILLHRLDRLTDRERTVVALRLGLEGDSLTLQEIGSLCGMTRESARSTMTRAIRKLGDDPHDPPLHPNAGRRSPASPRVGAQRPRQPLRRSRHPGM
jgi:RNA polymerase sigma factor (sigma-70 family)